jgi:hypothetical protein
MELECGTCQGIGCRECVQPGHEPDLATCPQGQATHEGQVSYYGQCLVCEPGEELQGLVYAGS